MARQLNEAMAASNVGSPVWMTSAATIAAPTDQPDDQSRSSAEHRRIILVQSFGRNA
jgi:hypothetical protein